MKQYAFSVIIPVFNKWALTRDCLFSLREHTGRDDFEVIVVDNASADATRSDLEPLGKSLFGAAFTAVRNAENINFGPACNLGAEQAAAPLLFFLNNDTLLTPGWYEPLHRALEDDQSLGAVGPLLVYEDNTVQHLGVAGSTNGLVHLYSRFPLGHPAVRRARALQFMTGAALLLPKTVFLSAGRFYEGYRNGFEDVELCVRIREGGKRLCCVPDSTIIHLESRSDGRHTGEHDNSRLLQERCGEALYPDLHLHGSRDGFQVVINGALGQSLLVPPEQDAELRARVSGKSYDDFYAAVCENPYWLWGHETLCGVLEKAGQYLAAAHFCGRILTFLPGYDCAKKLLRLATQAGNAELAAQAERHVRSFAALKASPKEQLRIVRSVIRTAEKVNDGLLLGLYTEKLASMAQESGA